MKNLLLVTLVFLFCWNFSFSQNDDRKGTPIKDLIPINRVKLESENFNNKGNESRSNENTTTSSVIQTTGNSEEVGTTNGELTISLTGGAKYDIPILVPPGINGVEPKITLSYNSQAGNDMAGYGWRINGISSITRVPSTIYHDGKNREVKFDNQDKFALDGQRLLLKNENDVYGGNGVEYQTENFSNLKIISHGTHSQGPHYFTVEFPDGSKAFYGNTSNSYSKSEWGISYMTNPLDLRINYEYLNLNNKLLIRSIWYGPQRENSSLLINSISFNYRTRNRSEKAFVNQENVDVNQILERIEVKVKNIGFRNYYLNHNINSLGYERLIKITEKTGDNTKSLNPTIFEYNDTPESVSVNSTGVSLSVGNINYLNSTTITGDFDGDGNQDIILYPTTGANAKKKYWYFNDINSNGLNVGYEHNIGSFVEMFPINWLSHSGKIMPDQGWAVVKNENTTTTSFNCYSSGISNPILYQYKVEYNFPKVEFGYFKYPCGSSRLRDPITIIGPDDPIDPVDPNPTWVSIVREIPKIYVNGDFNGDGLSDLVAIEKSVVIQYNNYCSTNTYSYPSGKTFFINLDRRLSSNQISISGNISISESSKILVADFNGDNKSDILVFNQGNVKVYTLNENNVFVLLRNYSDAGISNTRPILLGDYNGDGKADFIIPNNYGNNYTKYLSNGSSFVKSSEVYPFTYYESVSGGGDVDLSHLIPFDFNSDGKTDIIRVHNGSVTTSQGTIANITVHYYKNLGNTFAYQENAYTGYLSSIGSYATPVVLNYDKSNPNSEICFISKNSIFNFRCSKNNIEDNLLRKITLGNGVTERIHYSTLNSICDNGTSGCETTYGVNGYVENFPNFDIISASGFKLVSKIERQSLSTFKTKLYKYFGAVTNFEGKGFLGFRAIANTDWFIEGETKITNITKFDIDKRGVVKESYSVSGEFFYNFDFNSYTPVNFIQRNVYNYSDELFPNLVYKVRNDSHIIYDGLSGTSKEISTTFDQYNNPLVTTTIHKNGSAVEKTETVTVDYLPIEINPYILGRVQNRVFEVDINDDITTEEEKYTYNAYNLVTKVERKGHLTDYITEDFDYDSLGNLTQKTILPVGLAPRTQTYAYDTSGRYLISSTDVEGLVTSYHYDFDTGLLLMEELPSDPNFPLRTSFTYDKWGKMLTKTNYLGKKINYNYEWFTPGTNGAHYISAMGDDNSLIWIWYDDLNRKLAEGVKTINESSSSESSMTWKSFVYDGHDRITKEFEPVLSFFPNTTGLYKSFDYDIYGRPIKISDPTGKVTDISYNGLVTSTSDGVTNSTITKNSYGNVVSKSDNGGTIVYKYYANGNLKQSNLGNVELNIEQDGWGRRTKLIDPSAGEYTFEYNELGETIRTTTPKGETVYTLDNLGKIIEKTTIGIGGDPTNIKTTYTYDANTKLLINTRFDDFTGGFHTIHTFGYDEYRRLIFSDESGLNAYFKRATTYDSFGRAEKELYIAENISDGKRSEKWVRNTYKNGYHWQILDDDTNQLLWQLSKVNARGQLINANYGNNIQIQNTYDQYGYATQFRHRKTNVVPNVEIMTLNTTFEQQRGNLTSRYNSMFDYREDFTYDNLDRLTSWTKNNELFNFTFTSNTEGFLPTNANVIISNETISGNDRLKVTSNLNFEGTQRIVKTNAVAGEIIEIKGQLYFRNLIGETNYVKYSIIERDPVSGQTNEIPLGVNSGINFTFQHSVSQFSEISFKVVVGNDFNFQAPVSFSLDNIKVTEARILTQTYDLVGRIEENQVGVYNYTNNSKPYQNTSVDLNSEFLDYYLSRNNLNITYNTFKSPIDIIEEGKDKLSFSYNMNNQRSTMYYGSNEADKLLRPYRKHYSIDRSMEIKQNIQDDSVEFVTYIGGDAYSAPVVLKSDGTNQEYLYLHRDYLGSIIAITNQSANVLEKRIFDAWGNILKIQDGNGNNLSKLTVLDRGYTGHEHLQGVNLIHMNGRLYDPVVHRFLQPDNYIQDPYNTQNYNRYGYVLNNPLKYVDYSGETGEQPGGEMSGAEQSAIGSLIYTIAQNWDNWGIKDFFNDNVSNGFKSGGNWLSNNLKSANGWFDRNLRSINNALFGKKQELQSITVPQFNQVQSVNGWQNSGFQNSGNLEVYRNRVYSRMNLSDRFPSNINPNSSSKKDMYFLNELIKQVKGLNEAYLKAGSPELVFTNRRMDDYYAEYDANVHKVFISDRAFMDGRTNFDNAATLFHEFFHGMQYKYKGGEMLIYIQNITNQSPSHNHLGMGRTNKAAALMEMQAYYYEALMGNHNAFYTFSQLYNDIKNGKYK